MCRATTVKTNANFVIDMFEIYKPSIIIQTRCSSKGEKFIYSTDDGTIKQKTAYAKV